MSMRCPSGLGKYERPSDGLGVYHYGDLLDVGLDQYACIQDNTNHEPSASPTYWVKITGVDAAGVIGKLWTDGDDPSGTWSNCIQSCESLVYGGFSDWRMPNATEMDSLMSAENTNPAWFTEIIPDGDDRASGASTAVYWTSTTYKPTPTSVWTCSAANGTSAATAKTLSKSVKPVRSL